MYNFLRVLPAIGLVLASGCVSARATMLDPAKQYAPVPENQVRIFPSWAEVPASCEQVALIHAQGDVDATDKAQMLEAARRRAGKVGANAIVLTEMRDPSTGTRVAGAILNLPTDRKGQMLALYCPAGDATSQAANR